MPAFVQTKPREDYLRPSNVGVTSDRHLTGFDPIRVGSGRPQVLPGRLLCPSKESLKVNMIACTCRQQEKYDVMC